jgi:phage terminase large subunit
MNNLDELALLDSLIDQKKVAPKLEAFRPLWLGGTCPPYIRIKGARGGRGAGAKSWSIVSLIVQMADKRKLRIAALREIHKSLEESVYFLIKRTVERLGFRGWVFTAEHITSPVGSTFVFRGLKDLRASNNIKGLEGFDIFLIEEADSVSMESLDLIMPTLMRNEGAELWFCYNQNTEFDPVSIKLWNRRRDDAMCIELLPGRADNPWWNDGLQNEMELDYKFDPVLADHIWLGLPKSKGERCVMSRIDVRRCVDRIVAPIGGEQVGVDVARFGDDKTEIWHRHGMKIINHKTLIHADTQEVARTAFDMILRRQDVLIVVDDTGVGGGVTDKLRDLGAMTRGINFGGAPKDKARYTTVADELWFDFPLDQADIPDDIELIQELTSRQYDYDSHNRRKIEAKDVFKKRTGRSPDKSDALLLAFYNAHNLIIPSDDFTSRRRR